MIVRIALEAHNGERRNRRSHRQNSRLPRRARQISRIKSMSSSDDSAEDSSVSSTSSSSPPPVAKRVGRRKSAAPADPVVPPSLETKGKLIDEIEARYGDLAGLKSDKRGLKRICDRDPVEFGGKGTPERRGIQKQVQHWHRYKDTFRDDKQHSNAAKELEINMSRQLQLSRKAKAKKAPFVEPKKASFADEYTSSDSDDSQSPASK